MELMMTKQEFLLEYANWFPEKRILCEEHVSEFPEILSHVFTVEAINNEIWQAFRDEDTNKFERLCSFVEHVWCLVYHDENDEILNVISVTILESISDDNRLWQIFGSLIGNDFKEYINKVILSENIMMMQVEELR